MITKRPGRIETLIWRSVSTLRLGDVGAGAIPSQSCPRPDTHLVDRQDRKALK